MILLVLPPMMPLLKLKQKNQKFKLSMPASEDATLHLINVWFRPTAYLVYAMQEIVYEV